MNSFFQSYFGLADRRAVVTGAGRGIGKAIAQGLAAAGAEVLIHYCKSKDGAHKVVQEIQSQGGKAWSAQADLTNPVQVQSLFENVARHWSAIDILVNNTGDLVARSSVADATNELAEQVIRVNFLSAFYVSRTAIPLLYKGINPVILNIGSIAGHNGGANGATLYASAKGAIHTFTRGLAKELSPDIRVNAIAPGVILTDFHRKHTTEERLKAIAKNTPLQRLGRPEDHIAGAVFLCSNGASFITGEILDVNGGL